MLANEYLTSITSVGGGFFVGVSIGYALKKVLKLAAAVIGLLFAGIAYLQYQQIIDIKWAKFQALSQNAITALANAITQIPGFNSSSDHIASLALTNIGIPLTSSAAMGFAIGIMKG
ncbi:MAG TPA: FUN14 domain-containing protein [Nitrososphaeraceae archaeon]|nr:FUN14 domain-containing protein [Nitrososphaeraceae archaeon]